jgi:hypothetical protein
MREAGNASLWPTLLKHEHAGEMAVAFEKAMMVGKGKNAATCAAFSA